MADVKDKIRFLEEYREHPEKYLPMTENAWKHYEKADYGTEWYDDPWYNLGWDAGLAEGNRPYFMLCWVTTWEEIMEEMGYSESGVYKAYKKAPEAVEDHEAGR
jgi:hypothetical protein